MLSRYRILISRLSVTTRNLRSTFTTVPLPIFSKHKLTTPCILSFTLFTWVGVKEKLSTEDELIHTIKHCIIFIERNEYEKAEQLLHVALRQAQQIHHEIGITYIYDVMANLALQRDHVEKAKKLFVAVAQRLMQAGAQEDDCRVVHISAKLARTSHLQKEYSTAQLGYEWCLEKLEKIMEQDPSDSNKELIALTEDWYGRLFLDCDKCEDGLKLMLKSLDRMREVQGVDKEQLVIQLNDIGTVYDRLGRLDDSIQYFTEAVEMGKELHMDDNMGPMYVNLGRVYMKKEILDSARKYCGYAWRIGVTTKNNEIKQEAELCLNEIKNIS